MMVRLAVALGVLIRNRACKLWGAARWRRRRVVCVVFELQSSFCLNRLGRGGNLRRRHLRSKLWHSVGTGDVGRVNFRFLNNVRWWRHLNLLIEAVCGFRAKNRRLAGIWRWRSRFLRGSPERSGWNSLCNREGVVWTRSEDERALARRLWRAFRLPSHPQWNIRKILGFPAIFLNFRHFFLDSARLTVAVCRMRLLVRVKIGLWR